MPAGFSGAAIHGMLGDMRTTAILFTIMLLLEGCRDHTRAASHVPIVPPPRIEPTSAPPQSSALVGQASGLTTEQAGGMLHSIPQQSLTELLLNLVDAYFDLDQHDLREDARIALRSDAPIVKTIAAQSPDTKMIVEGHSDERGSAEYNLALAAMRAEAAKALLVELGVPETRLRTLTYGKERPQCTAQTEECWQKNRRAHLASEAP